MNALLNVLLEIARYIRIQTSLSPMTAHRITLTSGDATLLAQNNSTDLMKITIQNVTPAGAAQEVSISRDPITVNTEGFILDRLESRDFVLEHGQRLYGTSTTTFPPEVAVMEY